MYSILQFVQSPWLCFFIFITTIYFLILRRKPRFKEAPEAPGAWPILGHLHLLGGHEVPHKVLGVMADKCGPIYTIRMGVHRAVVVNNWEIAKECYTTNDIPLSSRPAMTAAQIMGYNYVMFIFSPYGAYWRDIRRITVSELLSNTRLQSLKHVPDSEINTSIRDLYENCAAPVEMKKWFGSLTLNIILRMITGKRYLGATSDTNETESMRCQNALRNFMRLIGVFILDDAVPYCSWLDLQGYKKEMKKTAKELDSLLQGWLDEHKEKRRLLIQGEINNEPDFMDLMMSILEDSAIANCDNDTTIKATCLSIIAGGYDTTTVTLTWVLSLLMNNKGVLKKAQEELDRHVGRDRQVKESDIKHLVYLQAIVKETLRLYPAGPLSGPRASTQDCTLAGYHVSAGTRVIVNIWKIQRDPVLWSDPSVFKPERFLTSHVDMDVQGNYEFMPFGGGRRACPGISFALQLVPFIVARLLHGFDLGTPVDMPVDMTETAGLTNAKATPLEVVIKPRLRPEIY